MRSEEIACSKADAREENIPASIGRNKEAKCGNGAEGREEIRRNAEYIARNLRQKQHEWQCDDCCFLAKRRAEHSPRKASVNGCERNLENHRSEHRIPG